MIQSSEEGAFTSGRHGLMFLLIYTDRMAVCQCTEWSAGSQQSSGPRDPLISSHCLKSQLKRAAAYSCPKPGSAESYTHILYIHTHVILHSSPVAVKLLWGSHQVVYAGDISSQAFVHYKFNFLSLPFLEEKRSVISLWTSATSLFAPCFSLTNLNPY